MSKDEQYFATMSPNELIVPENVVNNPYIPKYNETAEAIKELSKNIVSLNGKNIDLKTESEKTQKRILFVALLSLLFFIISIQPIPTNYILKFIDNYCVR